MTLEEATARIAVEKQVNADLKTVVAGLTATLTALTRRVEELAAQGNPKPVPAEKTAGDSVEDLLKAFSSLDAEARSLFFAKAALSFGQHIQPGRPGQRW